MQFASISFTTTTLCHIHIPYMNPQVFLCTILQPHIVLLKVKCSQEGQCPFLRYGFPQPPPIIKEFSANFSSIFQQSSILFACLVYGSNSNLTRDLYKKKNWVELLQGMYFTFVLISLIQKIPRYDRVALTFGNHTRNIKLWFLVYWLLFWDFW